MRLRTVLKIIIAVLTILFMVMSLLYIIKTHPLETHQGARAIAYAIIALVCATAYRYCED
jgi:succinate-acetate transporter protein